MEKQICEQFLDKYVKVLTKDSHYFKGWLVACSESAIAIDRSNDGKVAYIDYDFVASIYGVDVE